MIFDTHKRYDCGGRGVLFKTSWWEDRIGVSSGSLAEMAWSWGLDRTRHLSACECFQLGTSGAVSTQRTRTPTASDSSTIVTRQAVVTTQVWAEAGNARWPLGVQAIGPACVRAARPARQRHMT